MYLLVVRPAHTFDTYVCLSIRLYMVDNVVRQTCTPYLNGTKSAGHPGLQCETLVVSYDFFTVKIEEKEGTKGMGGYVSRGWTVRTVVIKSQDFHRPLVGTRPLSVKTIIYFFRTQGI